MKIGTSVNTSIGVEDKTYIIHDLFRELSFFLNNKTYGKDLNEIILGIICVSSEFEKFYPNKKPKYTDFKEYVTDGIKVVEDKLFTYTLKYDYEDLKELSEQENKELLANKILESLDNLDQLPKKIKDFDKEKFKTDLKQFFIDKELV
ncbi:hypothetical protein DI487_08045 [Flavobacterium sediminis]|uniref:Uncharacterized protein n=1 Tax=Flavobacterium sediminis TaxID=2201181 RepID=A0A2U8QUR1_9FLAO|nr:hypothetical protein [Flavobacterium sediminis]AWM13819.1 hypothetical protein DI487_08045 [Flavobacterium sediminis]